MRAAVIAEPGRVELADVSDPDPAPGEVVVAVGAVGVCGTDLHLVDGDFEGAAYPLVPGHEFAGTVVAVGADVGAAWQDARVAADPNIPCRSCRPCRRGRTNLCTNYAAVGVTRAGAAADYVAVPVERCVRLPDELPWATAALIEPLSCAVHGVERAGVRDGDRVLVYGAGTMGLLLARVAAAAGAEVVVVEPDADRRAGATSRGLMAVPAPTAAPEGDDGDTWDLVADCAGVRAAIVDGLARVAAGGTFLQFGVPPGDLTVPLRPFDVYRWELTILGSMAVGDAFDRAAEEVASGRVEVADLVTAVHPLENYADALDALRRRAGLKVQVAPEPGRRGARPEQGGQIRGEADMSG